MMDESTLIIQHDDPDDHDHIIFYWFLQYLYTHMYLQEIEMIQRQFKIYRLRKQIHLKEHQIKSYLYRNDILEYGYAPPIHDSPIALLRQGGFHYREAKRDFEGLSLFQEI